MKKNTLSRPHQTNKEFVEAAKISEQNAFIAVAIRRITGHLQNIPVRELVADLTFEEEIVGRDNFFSADWDGGEFAIWFESVFNVEIDWAKVDEAAKNAGYRNWFYNPDNYYDPDNYKIFILWKPIKQITYGEWVYLVTEKFLAPVRDKIIPSADWTVETSDLESDAVPPKNIPYILQFFEKWGCLCFVVVSLIFLIFLLIRFWIVGS